MNKKINSYWKTVKHGHMQMTIADGMVWADVMLTDTLTAWEWRAWCGTYTLEHGITVTLGGAQMQAENVLWNFYEQQHNWWVNKTKGESDEQLEEMLNGQPQ